MVTVTYFHKPLTRNLMPEKDVFSPASRFGSKVGSGQHKSPGAFSNTSRGRAEGVPSLPSNIRVSRNAEEPAELKITGPEE
jgi:hypothetical protein